ncbi:MAG: hypothetical protein ABIP03_07435 [Aquihabitans sp.]
MSRQQPDLPTPAEARDKRDDVVLGRGVSDHPMTVDELQVIIDGVRRDDVFMGLLRSLDDRDAEILDRLAVG